MIGDIVIYYINEGDGVSAFTRSGNIEKLPAIVTGVNGTELNLSVFTNNPQHPVTQQFHIPHKDNMKPQQAYWDHKEK